MARMQIIGDPMKDLLEDLDAKGGDLKAAVNEMLEETQKYIQSEVVSAAAPYAAKGLKGYAQGEMYKTIVKDGSVHWETPTVASVNGGFNLSDTGGYHSIFIMYGTPRITKDTRVFNAIKGARVRKQIEQLQKDILEKYLKL